MKFLIYITVALTINLCFAQISDFETVDFTKANNVSAIHYGENLDNLPLLAFNLTSKLNTDAEKFRAIYLWVCQNIKNDQSQGDHIISKRKKLKNDSLALLKWNNTYKKTTFKRLLKHKKTICTGYAYLIKELCFLTNIECKIIDGYGRSASSNIESLEFANHSWNAVKLNNKWYLCDATWASGYSFNGKFIKDYNDGYFLTEPILFAKNHYPLQKKWLLNTELIQSEFKAEPIVYGDTFKHNILPVLPKALFTEVKKHNPIQFKYQLINPLITKKISLVQFTEHKVLEYPIDNLNTKNNVVSFTTQLKHRGFYDLHLKVDNDIVATYTFKVVK